MTLVLDASMALAWLFERARPDEAVCAELALTEIASAEVLVPPLWHLEIANALLMAERRKVVSEANVMDYLARLAQLPVDTDTADLLSRRDSVMALAREHRLTAYDATYLDLALRSNAVLATFDVALATAMRQAGGLVFGDNLPH